MRAVHMEPGYGDDSDDFNFYVGRAGTQLRSKPQTLVSSRAGAVTLVGMLASGGLCGPVNSSVRCCASG
jgi:hypothetical protein